MHHYQYPYDWGTIETQTSIDAILRLLSNLLELSHPSILIMKQSPPQQQAEPQRKTKQFPTLQSALCSANRDNVLTSPPTVPYTLDKMNVNQEYISYDMNNLQPSPESTKSNNSNTSTSNRISLPKCDGTYGTSSSIKIPQCISDSNTVGSMKDVPMEDVMRWKEFRRKQKVEASRYQVAEGESGEEVVAVKEEQTESVKETKSKSLAEKIGEELPSVDSLCLSLSESSSMEDLKKSFGKVIGTVKSAESKEDGDGVINVGGSGSVGEKEAVAIDLDGFPVSPTSISVASGFVSTADSVSAHVTSTACAAKEPVEFPAEAYSGDMLTEHFSELDIGDGASDSKDKGVELESAAASSDVPTEITSNTIFARLLASSPSGSNGGGSTASRSNVALDAINEASSEVLTETTSNTARYMANKSTLLVKRMMLMQESYKRPEHGSPAVAASQASVAPPTTPFTPSVGSTSSTPFYDVTPVSSSRERPDPRALPYSPMDPSSSFSSPLTGGDAIESNTKAIQAKDSRKKDDSVAWDDTKTTLDSDQLADAFSESPAPAVALEDNKNDLSTVSSNWDPLQVTMIQEEEEEKEGGNNSNEKEGDGGDESLMEIDAADDQADNSFTVKDSSPATNSPPKELPTLTEVKSFMTQLDALREETHSAKAKTSRTASCDEGDIVVKQDTAEFMRSLLEKKEKLRQFKLDSERKKQELDIRLRAMRSKVYNESDTAVAKAVEDTSKQVPAARWSGGLARWSPSGSSSKSPSPPSSLKSQPATAPLNVAFDQDDFSFKPSAVAMVSNIPISPLVAGGGADARFSFEDTKKVNDTNNKQHALSPMGGLKPLMSPPLNASSKSALFIAASNSSHAEETIEANTRPETPTCTSPPLSSASPDMSEGDKGGGGFGFGDKSVASNSSSRFVEFGGRDSEQGHKGSLLGVTVLGSKKKKGANNLQSSVFETVGEQSKDSHASLSEQSVRNVAPDPPGKDSGDIWVRWNQDGITGNNTATERKEETSDLALDKEGLQSNNDGYTNRQSLSCHSKSERLQKINSTISALKSKFEASPPVAAKASASHQVEPIDEDNDVKEERGDVSSSPSDEVLTVGELRSRFELGTPTKGDVSGKSASAKKRSVIKPSQVSLQQKELQTMSSLESSTYETVDSTLMKSIGNDGTDGENSLDTKRIFTYSKMAERRDHPIEENDSKSLDNTKDTNSSKENNAVKAGRSINNNFPNFSPVAMRKKAFERSTGNQSSQYVKSSSTDNLKDKVLICQKNTPSNEEDKVATTPRLSNQGNTPATSVKDRIAAFTSSTSNNNHNNVRPFSSPQKTAASFQKQTPPPRTIEMNQTNQTPSPLWVSNRGGINLFSPMDNVAPSQMSRMTPGRNQMVGSPHGYDQNRPSTLQTGYESPNPRQFDDDDEDGITLSPTCSEVSGLTIPTCLGSVADDASRATKESGVFSNLSVGRSSSKMADMSPIARHRQQNAFSFGNVSQHPYMQRVSSHGSSKLKEVKQTNSSEGHQNNPTPKAKNAQQTGSRRDQIISRVRDKAATPKRATPKSSSGKALPSPRSNNVRKPQQPSPRVAQRRNQWQDNNVIAEVSYSTSDEQHVASGKGRVAERVAVANKRMSSGGAVSRDKRKYRGARNEDQSSFATRDCVRVD